jgi:signal peptidase I
MTREVPTDDVEEQPDASTDRRSSGSDNPSGSRSRGIKLFLRDILVIFVAALVISFLIKTFLIRSFYIPSESMESTLLRNDRIIVSLLSPEPIGINRGDVVVFQDPGGWLTPTPKPERSPLEEGVENVLAFVGLAAPDSEDHLIKRVIGLPGDMITCCDDFGHLTVNGVPLEETYTQLPTGVSKATEHDFEVTVPDGSLWVMGDNRYNSSDSSYHHFMSPGHEYVPLDKVVGRAILITWPLDRWTWLDNYPLVFRGVDAAGE